MINYSFPKVHFKNWSVLNFGWKVCSEWKGWRWNSWIFLDLEEEKGKTAGIEVKDEKVRIAYEDVATAKGKGIANQNKGQAT